MEPLVYRATQPIERLGAMPGDKVYIDPSHPDVIILYRKLHIRVSGAVLNMVEDGVLEDITPSYDDPSPRRPALRLSYGGAPRPRRARRRPAE